MSRTIALVGLFLLQISAGDGDSHDTLHRNDYNYAEADIIPWKWCTYVVSDLDSSYKTVYTRATLNLQITCELGPGDGDMTYHQLEQFAFTVWNYTIEITIRCSTKKTHVEFRSYMPIGNLMVVDVSDCLMSNFSGGYRDYFSENNSTEVWFQEDNRQVIRFVRCSIESEFQDEVVRREKFPSVPDCGSISVRSLYYKSCDIKVANSPVTEDGLMWEQRYQQARNNPNSKPVVYSCVYSKLTYLDYSGTKYFSNEKWVEELRRKLYPFVKTLNVSGTDLTYVPRGVQTWGWGEFPGLEQADFSYCKISMFTATIDRRAAAKRPIGLHFYTDLDLRGNKISHITQENVELFKSGTLNVDVRENVLSCDCSSMFTNSLVWLAQAINVTSDISTTYYSYVWDLVCSPTTSHLKMEGLTLRMYYLNDYCSNTATSTSSISETSTQAPGSESAEFSPLVTLVVGVVFLLVIAIIVLYILFRRTVNAVCKYHGIKLLRLHSNYEPNLKGDKTYHVFISFCVADVAYALEILEKLEPTYKCFIFHRDVLPGTHIAEELLAGIQRSKYTLMLISQKFIDSLWCQYEFKQAHFQSVEERRDLIIPILVEDIDMTKLDLDLQTYLTQYSYLQKGEVFFWEKLIARISSRTTREILLKKSRKT